MPVQENNIADCPNYFSKQSLRFGVGICHKQVSPFCSWSLGLCCSGRGLFWITILGVTRISLSLRKGMWEQQAGSNLASVLLFRLLCAVNHDFASSSQQAEFYICFSHLLLPSYIRQLQKSN